MCVCVGGAPARVRLSPAGGEQGSGAPLPGTGAEEAGGRVRYLPDGVAVRRRAGGGGGLRRPSAGTARGSARRGR